MSEMERLRQENAELKRQLETQRKRDTFDCSVIKFNEKEAHCIARILQGAIYAKDFLAGCSFCKFPCKLVRHNHRDEVLQQEQRWRQILNKLTEKTGVDCGIMESENLYGSEFPYKRFLRNANDEAKDYFRNYFFDISTDL